MSNFPNAGAADRLPSSEPDLDPQPCT